MIYKILFFNRFLIEFNQLWQPFFLHSESVFSEYFSKMPKISTFIVNIQPYSCWNLPWFEDEWSERKTSVVVFVIKQIVNDFTAHCDPYRNPYGICSESLYLTAVTVFALQWYINAFNHLHFLHDFVFLRTWNLQSAGLWRWLWICEFVFISPWLW